MRKISVFIFLALLLALGASPAYAVPALPHAFYGSVSVNGSTAPDGTQISATVDSGTIIPTQNPVFTKGGNYGVDSLKLLVQGDIPPNAVITFHVTNADGTATGGTYIFESGAGPTPFDILVNISKPPAGGGGGGGGQFLSDANYCGAETKFWITSTGRIVNTFTAGCEGGPLTITVKKNTIALDEDGKPLKLLEIQENQNPPDPPSGANIITIPYTLEPSGATFDPALVFTWEYDQLPEGAEVDSLVIAFWNGSKWVYFDCEVDTKNKTITAEVDHFTTFALLVSMHEEELPVPPVTPLPATFLLSNLTVTPSEIQLGETVTISATVTNTGETTGSYDVTFDVDGVVHVKAVQLNGGDSQLVTFDITPEEGGSYTVTVSGLTGSFTVTVPEVTEPVDEEEEEEPTPFPWWLVVVTVLVLSISIGLILMRRRR